MTCLRTAAAAAVIICAALAASCGSSSPLIPALPPVPTLTAVSPAAVTTSSTPRALTVTGTGFAGAGAFVMSIDGPSVPPTTITAASDTEIKLTCTFLVAGTYKVTVSVRGQKSNELSILATAPSS